MIKASSFLQDQQHCLLKRGLNSSPLESYSKALLNPQRSFIRWLPDTGDKMLEISVFWFSVYNPRKNFGSEGNTYSLSRKINVFLDAVQIKGEVLYQWQVDLSEISASLPIHIQKCIGREAVCSPSLRHSSAKSGDDFPSQCIFRRVGWCYRDVVFGSTNHGLATEWCHTKFYADLPAKTKILKKSEFLQR